MVTSLYTMNGVVKIMCYKMICSAKKCMKYWTGEQEMIFRSSDHICAGYEVGWHFVNSMRNVKCDFEGFCKQMTCTYQQISSNSAFMSPGEFIRWFFSWASHQKLEFRQQCIGCGSDPKALVGYSVRIDTKTSSQNSSPFEEFKGERLLYSKHGKLDRCFLPDKNEEDPKITQEARLHLQWLCKGVLGKEREEILADDADRRLDKLMQTFPEPCKALLVMFTNGSLCTTKSLAAAQLLYELGSHAPLRSFVPHHLLHSLSDFIKAETITNETLEEFILFCNRESFLVSTFLRAFHNDNRIQCEAAVFLDYICRAIKRLHVNDKGPVACNLIKGSYNPAKNGRAYYFEEYGRQAREAKKFRKRLKEINIVNPPSDNCCSSNHPSLSLWFCPLHGHCWGFHFSKGEDEGLKDPFDSLHTHLKHAPDIILHDLACELEEYCLDREAGFFRATKFYHNVFHEGSLKCSDVYDSRRMLGTRVYDSSIFEEFDSFMETIKSVSNNISRLQLTFLVQFLFKFWNDERRTLFINKVKIAAFGAK